MTQTRVERMTSPDAPQGPAIQRMSFVLPAAPPQTYLRWMRWWRASERRARERYEGADLACRLALAPHPSALFWDVIAQDLSRQAGRAKALGRQTVIPRITITNVALVHALGYMDRRQRFLEFGIAEHAMGIAAPDDEFVRLRDRVLQEARRQLAATARARTAPARTVVSPRTRDRRGPLGNPVVRRRARSRARSHASHRPGQAA
jgi:hypothetical protein